jgi:flagellar hook assembly protein FlgD
LQRLLTTFVLVGLLVATAAAFAITERLKLTKSPIYGTQLSHKGVFSPKCGCTRSRLTVAIKLRKVDDVTVRFLDAHKEAVRELPTVRVGRGRSVFRWDGRTDEGSIAPDGTYKAEIALAAQHQTIVLPNVITLDTTPPGVTSVALDPPRDTFSPDGDGQADYVRITYKLTKPAHVNVYLGTTRIIRTHKHGARGSFSWFGDVAGQKVQPGWYTLRIGAVDTAGNSTPVAKRARVRVRLRYIELDSKRIVVPGGSRFTVGVSTDAKRYTWRLGARKSVASGSELNLLASTRRGRYTLTVSVHGHASRATVIVR